MAVEIEIDVGDAAEWIEHHQLRRRTEGEQVRDQIGGDELDRLRAMAADRRSSPEWQAKEQEKTARRARCERDGDSVDDESVPGFYARSRFDGAFKVMWGNDPGSANGSRLMVWKEDLPAWTCSINFRIVKCWVARTGICVAQVAISNQGEGGADASSRSLFLVFSPTGGVSEHFQMREGVDDFLGIDEVGENYVCRRMGRTSLIRFGTHDEWHHWMDACNSYWHFAQFVSETKRIRLHASGGTVLELCWEDQAPSPMDELRRHLDCASHPSGKLKAIRTEWEFLSLEVQRRELAQEFLALIDSISVDALRLDSWYGEGPLDLLRLRVDVLDVLDDPAAAVGARTLLNDWETALLFPRSAVDSVKESLQADDLAGIGEVEARINECLSSPVLKNDPQMLARVWRAKGHLEEARGNFEIALTSFNTAIALWGGVGCVRDASRLEKRLNKTN